MLAILAAQAATRRNVANPRGSVQPAGEQGSSTAAQTVDVCIPVYNEHQPEMAMLFGSAVKFIQDSDRVLWRLVPGTQEEVNQFKTEAKAYPTLHVNVTSLQDLVSSVEGQSFLESSGLQDADGFVEKYTKWPWQSLKKMYCTMTATSPAVIALDADSMWVRPASLSSLVANFYAKGGPVLYFNLPDSIDDPEWWPRKANERAQAVLGEHDGEPADAPYQKQYFGFALGYWWLFEPSVMKQLKQHLAWRTGGGGTQWFKSYFANASAPELAIETIYLRYLFHKSQPTVRSKYKKLDAAELFARRTAGDPEAHHDVQECVSRYTFELVPHCDYVQLLTPKVIGALRGVYEELGGALPAFRFACTAQAATIHREVPQIKLASSKQCPGLDADVNGDAPTSL